MSLEVPPFTGTHPTICVLDNKTLVLMSFGQLENKDKKQIKNSCKTLQESIGGFADMLPPLPSAGSADEMIWWLLCTQCELIKYTGLQLTPSSFGAPPGFNGISPGKGRGFNGGA